MIRHSQLSSNKSNLGVPDLKGQTMNVKMAWRILVILNFCTCIAASARKLPGRKEAILGETYFGSEQVLKTEIDDVKPFIAEFTLLETGLEVSGSAEEIHEQFERHNKENVTYSELVINLKFNWTNRYSLLDFNLLHNIQSQGALITLGAYEFLLCVSIWGLIVELRAPRWHPHHN